MVRVASGSSAPAAATCSAARRRAVTLAARTRLNAAWAMAAARACGMGADRLLQNLSAHASMSASCGPSASIGVFSPCRSAFLDALALPAAVLGPVLRRAFARFASICAWEVIELRIHAEHGHSQSRRRLEPRRRNRLLFHAGTPSASVAPSLRIGAAIGESPFRRHAPSQTIARQCDRPPLAGAIAYGIALPGRGRRDEQRPAEVGPYAIANDLVIARRTPQRS